MECFECLSQTDIHLHHVVPRSLGGTQTIPLCSQCHSLVHQKDLTKIRTLTSAAMRYKQSKGEYIGGRAPYGFELVSGELVEHPGEQAVISAAKEMRSAGLSLRAIAAGLEGQGFNTRNGSAFTATQVKRMIS